jgi:hypothetical protein
MQTNHPTALDRFEELVKLHTTGRQFLDRDVERKLLEEGITRFNLSFDQARGAVRSAVADSAIVLEGDLDASARQLLRTLADRRGRIRREDFETVASFYRARSSRQITQPDARGRVKRLMEEADLQPARAGRFVRTRRWYRQIEA